MNHRKKIGMGLILCLGVVLVACENKEEVPTNDAEIALNEPSGAEDITGAKTEEKTEGKIDVAVVGSTWEKQTNVSFVQVDWTPSLPKEIRFVLIPYKEDVSQEKQKMLQTWIREDKVILFYGKNVQPEEVKEKIGMEIGTFELKSDASFDFPYLLYGYGFSNTYEQYVPIFLGSNTYTDFEEKIANFLLKNKNF